jgi:hypothetical protein
MAECHLKEVLEKTPGVTYCQPINKEGAADLHVRIKDGPLLTVECKNVLRETDAKGLPRLDKGRALLRATLAPDTMQPMILMWSQRVSMRSQRNGNFDTSSPEVYSPHHALRACVRLVYP